MQLLDLPPEIFQRIVRVLVKKTGLKNAWKARGTSRAFQAYITYEALATPSLYAYNKSRKILKNSLADFLYIRSISLNGFVRDHLPHYIRDVMLALAPWVTDDAAASALRKALCELFVSNHADAMRCLVTDVNRLNDSSKNSISMSNTFNLVAAAAATGNLKALRHFANKDKTSLWIKSSAFGYPLEVAVYAGQSGVVKTIAQQAITNQRKTVADMSVAEHLSFRGAMSKAIQLRHHDILAHLLTKYLEAFGPVTEACMAIWLDTAVTVGNVRALSLLLNTTTRAGASTFYKAFVTTCSQSNADLLPLFFLPPDQNRNRLSINSIYGSTYPLLTAIDARFSVTTVGKLLKLGADPNGPAYLRGLDRPLLLAARLARDRTISLLLKDGANPHLVNRAGFVKKLLKRFKKGVRRVLKAALARDHVERLGAEGGVEFLAEVDGEEEEGEEFVIDAE